MRESKERGTIRSRERAGGGWMTSDEERVMIDDYFD